MLYIISLFLSFHSYSSFKELETKQSIDNLKYISSDGKVTYYQTDSGELNLTKNYDNYSLKKSKKNTKYNVYASNKKRKVLISVDESYYSHAQVNKILPIYVSNYGSKKIQLLSSGLLPKLHLNDEYASFYNHKSKILHFLNIDTKRKVEIPLIANSPYFRPQKEMVNSQDIIYTDINEKNEIALLYYSNIDKKKKVLFKSNTKNTWIKFCLTNDIVYLFEASTNNEKPFSNIYAINLFNNDNFKNKENIYGSTFSDNFNPVCTQNEIYFIRTLSYNQVTNYQKNEITKFDLKKRSLKSIKSDLNPTQIMQMDQLILTFINGKVYLVNGSDKPLTKDALIKDKK